MHIMRTKKIISSLFLGLMVPLSSFAANPGGTSSADQWTMPLGTNQGTNYSNLTLINSANVGNLIEERHLLTGSRGGHEGQPLVVKVGIKKRMFVVTPWPNSLIAFDMSGTQLWKYTPPTSPFAQGVACCDIVNRGAIYHSSGLVIYSRLDGTVVAVNASTGKLKWQKAIANPKVGETLTGAPIIVGNNVIVGNAGGEMGVRGWVQALNVTSGAVVWKAYNTGPDSDVKINPSQNFYPNDRGVNLGSTTWGNGTVPGRTNIWMQGGATVWSSFTYEPSVNLIFYGTANPGVWNPDMRTGDNKWSSSIVARNPATGEAKWITQLTPHDGWDYDSMNESTVISTSVPSGKGKALIHFDKNGFAYMLDAWTGQIIRADKFVTANWADHIDLASGEPVLNPSTSAHELQKTENICPSPLGGKEFTPAAYSPDTGNFYIPSINFCSSLEPLEANYIAGSPFMGADVGFAPDFTGGSMKPFGEVVAWDPLTGSAKWRLPEPAAPLFGGIVATAGNIIFYGTLDGHFKVVNAETGNVLKDIPLECGVQGNPITYLGDDGKQRIAVFSGVGWLPGGFVGGNCPAGSVGSMENEAPMNPGKVGYGSGAVHIFRLP